MEEIIKEFSNKVVELDSSFSAISGTLVPLILSKGYSLVETCFCRSVHSRSQWYQWTFQSNKWIQVRAYAQGTVASPFRKYKIEITVR